MGFVRAVRDFLLRVDFPQLGAHTMSLLLRRKLEGSDWFASLKIVYEYY